MTPAQHHVSSEFLEVRHTLKLLAISLTRDPDRAQDLMQDVYLRAVEKAHLFEQGTNFIAWATVLMKNHFISTRRLSKNQPHEGLSTVDLPTIKACQEDGLRLREVIHCMKRIMPHHRKMLLMVGLEGMTYDQAAKAAGVKEGTVKSAVSRSRDVLRRNEREGVAA
jgi:RNA polymerase sigma-70 factor (ECF subfamily)